ncbi:MAG: hypothetical protein JXA74_02780 [Anaerolineae bacterium]|nr:hypothetical protein [Anaerolineae bacterium]
MRNRASLYIGLLLLALGGFFLLASITEDLGGPLGQALGWGGLWPLIILVVGVAFWLPIFIWWDRREQLAGLAIPGAIVTVNGLLLLYQNMTGDWDSWAYAWAVEPMAVGLGLLCLYLLTPERPRGLLVAAAIVGGVGALFFIIFGSVFGGAIRIAGPVLLILIGLLVILRGVRGQPDDDRPAP